MAMQKKSSSPMPSSTRRSGRAKIRRISRSRSLGKPSGAQNGNSQERREAAKALEVMDRLSSSPSRRQETFLLEWAKDEPLNAEQLAYDAARLLGSPPEQAERLGKFGFFHRCRLRFSPKTGEGAAATPQELVFMQEMAVRYLTMLMEHDLLAPHALVTLKNDLQSLVICADTAGNFVRSHESSSAIASAVQRLAAQAAQRQQKRAWEDETPSFSLEHWLQTAAHSNRKASVLGILRLINDFYAAKNDNWSWGDLAALRHGMAAAGIYPDISFSQQEIMEDLLEEADSVENGLELFLALMRERAPSILRDHYSQYAAEHISSSIPFALHILKLHWQDRLAVVEELRQELGITVGGAIRRLLRRRMLAMNVDLRHKIPLWEVGIELLAALRLVEKKAQHERESLESRFFSDYLQDMIIFPFRFLLCDPRPDLYIRCAHNHEKARRTMLEWIESTNAGMKRPIFSIEDIAVFYDGLLAGREDCGFVLTTSQLLVADRVKKCSFSFTWGNIHRAEATHEGVRIHGPGGPLDIPCLDRNIKRALVATIRCTRSTFAILKEDMEEETEISIGGNAWRALWT